MPLPIYLMSNFPSVRPSLNLQFDSQPTPEDMTSHLASVGATFSRASIGTYTDANGLIQEASAGQARPNYSTAGVHEGLLIEESRVNLIKSSEDLTTDTSILSGATVTINKSIAPDGTASADKLEEDGGTGIHGIGYQCPTVSGTKYSISAFVKADENEYIQIRFGGGEFGAGTYVNFDLTDGSIGTNNVESANIENVGNGWFKISATDTATVTNATGYPAQFRLIQSRTASENESYASTKGDGFYLWGLQMEAGSFPTSYIPTIPTFSSRASTATYFDSSGVLQTASTNVARTDHKYIDGQWVEAGLLLESASTNLHLNSGDLTGNNSVVNEVSLSLQTVTNPINGQTQVTRITDTAVSDAHYIQSSTITADGSSDYTFSILAKAGTISTCRIILTGGGVSGVAMIVDLSDGSILSGSGTVEDVGNGWYILSVTGTSTASSALASRVYTTDGTNITYTGSGEYIYVAYRQLEVGSQPTSYIPTSGSTADRALDDYDTNTKERSADVCYIDGTAFTDFYNQEQGTILLDAVSPTIGSDTFHAYGIYSATSERIQLQLNNSSTSVAVVDEGVIQANLGDSAISDNTEFKHIFAFKLNDFATVLDGGTPLTDTSGTIPTPSEISIGRSYVGDRYFTGGLKKLIYFPRRLGSVGNNNELIKLTQ